MEVVMDKKDDDMIPLVDSAAVAYDAVKKFDAARTYIVALKFSSPEEKEKVRAHFKAKHVAIGPFLTESACLYTFGLLALPLPKTSPPQLPK